MLITFGATFLGVMMSFLLWFGGEWYLKRDRDKKALKEMMREMEEEIVININLLKSLTEKAPEMLEGGRIPMFIPQRLKLEVYDYVVATGDIR